MELFKAHISISMAALQWQEDKLGLHCRNVWNIDHFTPDYSLQVEGVSTVRGESAGKKNLKRVKAGKTVGRWNLCQGRRRKEEILRKNTI